MQMPDGTPEVPVHWGGEVPVANEGIESLFTYHAPTEDDKEAYARIRGCAKTLAYIIHAVCPPSADRTTAIRKLSECVMTANASIARRGVGYR